MHTACATHPRLRDLGAHEGEQPEVLVGQAVAGAGSVAGEGGLDDLLESLGAAHLAALGGAAKVAGDVAAGLRLEEEDGALVRNVVRGKVEDLARDQVPGKNEKVIFLRSV